MIMSEQITQEDREAAAAWQRHENPELGDAAGAGTLIGQYDKYPLVQAFARHRIAALSTSPSGQGVSGEVGRIAAMAVDVKDNWDRGWNGAVDAVVALLKNAAPAPSCAPREVERLTQALRDVVNPLGYLQRIAEAEGSKLGSMAYTIANDLTTVQRIASDALSPQGPDAK